MPRGWERNSRRKQAAPGCGGERVPGSGGPWEGGVGEAETWVVMATRGRGPFLMPCLGPSVGRSVC